MTSRLIGTTALFSMCSLAFGQIALAQPALVVKSLAEKKVAQLPAGPLFWRLETFPALDAARAAAGPTALVAESAGKVWLFTLGLSGVSSPGGTHVAEIGPVPPVAAPQLLLRVNEASGPPGSNTSVHTHPGSETFYVLAGEQRIRTPHGILRIPSGRRAKGHTADTPMQVSSSGSADLYALVMFGVDATRPFSSPASWPQ